MSRYVHIIVILGGGGVLNPSNTCLFRLLKAHIINVLKVHLANKRIIKVLGFLQLRKRSVRAIKVLELRVLHRLKINIIGFPQLRCV